MPLSLEIVIISDMSWLPVVFQQIKLDVIIIYLQKI
jgi:hypothetical protein